MFNLYTASKAMGYRGLALAFLFVGSGLIWFMQCYGDTHDSELSQGQRVIYQMMGQETLERAGFFDAYPEAKPSDFVEFVNTEEGAVLWAPTAAEYYSSHDPTRRPGSGPPRILQPNNITFTPYRVDPNGGKQVVYVPHDDLGKIEFRGYRSPDGEPFQVSKWGFPSTAGPIDF